MVPLLCTDLVTLHPRDQLSARVGPVLDRLTIWPVDDGRYGLDETFQGAGGFERARHDQQQLEHRGVPFSFRQEVMVAGHDDSGRLPAVDIAAAQTVFVY